LCSNKEKGNDAVTDKDANFDMLVGMGFSAGLLPMYGKR
jgi:hypothetical protein